jgi:hypothetical protein
MTHVIKEFSSFRPSWKNTESGVAMVWLKLQNLSNVH